MKTGLHGVHHPGPFEVAAGYPFAAIVSVCISLLMLMRDGS